MSKCSVWRLVVPASLLAVSLAAHGQQTQSAPSLSAPPAAAPLPQAPAKSTDSQAGNKIPPAGSAEADKPAVPVAEIVARINDQIVSKADLTRAGDSLEQEIAQDKLSTADADERRKALLSDLIDQQILLSRAKELGLNPDDEVIRRLDEIRKQYHMDSMEDLEKAARSQGVSFEDFKQNIRNNVLTQMVIREEVTRNMHLSADDLHSYYEAHKERFEVPESVTLSEILIPAGDTEETAKAAEEKANKIEEDLKHGSDFNAMAKTVSQGPTAAEGGELGVFKRDQLAKELEDKTFALQAGGVTEPVRTRQGYVILKVNQHQTAGLRPYKEVEEQVQNMAYQDHMQPTLRAYLTKQRETAFIDIRPGYTDVHASPNESKPVFSAYAPPDKKNKKAKTVKYRYRNRSTMPKNIQAPANAPDLEHAKAQAGGPTAIASKTYAEAEANPAPAPAAVPAVATTNSAAATGVSKSRRASKKNANKPVKVRYGQKQQEAQLPPSAIDAAQPPDAAATTQTATNAAPADTERLSPEARKILGVREEKENKTRFSSRPVLTRTQQKNNDEIARNANAPAGPDADETAMHAVTNQPLGLNGDTAHAKAPKPTEKQRLQAKTDQPVAKQPNAGTPGSAGYNAATDKKPVAETAQTKRHKLFGIL